MYFQYICILGTPHVSGKMIQNLPNNRKIHGKQSEPEARQARPRPKPGGHVQCSDSALLPLILPPPPTASALPPLFRRSPSNRPRPSALPPVCCSYNERRQTQSKITHTARRSPARRDTMLCICEYQLAERCTDTQILGTHTATGPVCLRLRRTRAIWRMALGSGLWSLAFTLRCVFHIPKAKAVLRSSDLLGFSVERKILYSEPRQLY